MSVRVLIHKRLKESFDATLLAEITRAFRQYKETGERPTNFGRDVPYDFPQSVVDSDLWHIHIRDETSRSWDVPQMRVFKMTSNTALIYTRGCRDPNCYLIISIIANAHAYYGGTQKYLREMAEIARGFQRNF